MIFFADLSVKRGDEHVCSASSRLSILGHSEKPTVSNFLLAFCFRSAAFSAHYHVHSQGKRFSKTDEFYALPRRFVDKSENHIRLCAENGWKLGPNCNRGLDDLFEIEDKLKRK
jgi:hypothetical protein